ncbi:MAG TPA: hypothetical protein VGR29_05615, partial [Thermomicrobiales bacterium]|nr:hypothetical protein [Thermomicrobiales bacterium]
MPSSDQPITPPTTGIPTPPGGAGAADLATDSTDPQILRELLDRARERLAFYESFDRIIGENIRRSGELMVETVALREQAQALAAQSAMERATFAATRQTERDRYRALVEQVLNEVSTVRPLIDTMVTRFESVLEELSEDTVTETGAGGVLDSTSISTNSALEAPSPESSETDEPPPVLVEDETPVTHVDPPAEEPAQETTEITTVEDAPPPDVAPEITPEEPAPEGSRGIDLLAHGVPNARVAISLQKMLRELDVVSSVEAREFANGELRLAIQASDALPEAALVAWLGDNNGELTSKSSSVTE